MWINATYKVVTPMFCGGAEPETRPAELRLASFKGALRFWWRALAWSRLDGQLEAIRRQEEYLFGSAESGQSRVLMKLHLPDRNPKILKANSMLRVPSGSNAKSVGHGARYLGYGVIATSGKLARACLQAPFSFTVQIRYRDLDEEQRRSLENALIALGTLGGMGAKSRKGYGSLALQSLCVNGKKQWEPPSDIDGLKNEICKLYGNVNGGKLPEFTALSNLSRHVLLSSERTEPVEMLDLVGRELVRYRSWGRNGKILRSEQSERIFEFDQNLMKAVPRHRSAHPQRIAFGLPHNYGKSPGQQVGPCNDFADRRDIPREKLDRRASPLFIHIHECATTPVAVLSFLPARFLPKGRDAISVGGRKIKQKPENELYIPVCNFLDRLLDESQYKERFIGPVEVKL